jgi:hypothetical protein
MVVKRGEAPHLECSTRGDTRLSPFCARPSCLEGHSIEEAYHAMKVFDDGATGLSWKEAKSHQKAGHTVVNYEDCGRIYSYLWDRYIEENPHLLEVIRAASGLSDIFGREGSACQVVELWRIRNEEK